MDKIQIFKKYINTYTEIEDGILNNLIEKLEISNFKIHSDKMIEDIATKMSYFIFLNNHLQVKELDKSYKVLNQTLYDFDSESDFLNYYHKLTKNDLLIIDKDNILDLNTNSIIISTYKKKDEIKEYFNYLIYEFSQNCLAMRRYKLTEKDAQHCGFYGYIDIIESLLNDYSYFQR